MLKKIIFTGISIIFLTSILFPQVHGKMKAVQKMEELKKLKLMEILDMSEEVSLKFFTRRAEHIKKMDELNNLSRQKIVSIDSLIKSKNDQELRKAIDEYLQIIDNQFKERQNFLKSATEILSIEQLGKLVVFEDRFKHEISGLLFRERNKRMRDD